MKQIWALFLIPTVTISCGPSPEALTGPTSIAATSVAASWTQTPTSVPGHTSTSVPINTQVITPTMVQAHSVTPPLTREPGRHYEDQGGFSFIPAVGWAIRELPGFKFKGAFGPLIEDFTPNIVIVDEVFEYALDDYFELNLLFLEEHVDPMEIIEPQEDFVTESGLRSIRILWDDGDHLVLQFYVGGNPRKIVVTCSMPYENREAISMLCDESMWTFRYDI